MKKMDTMDRRAFLQKAALLGVGAGAVALSGCSNAASQAPAPADTADETTAEEYVEEEADEVGLLPSDIANLPVIKAEPWVQVSNSSKDRMEGPIFDSDGVLYVCHRWTTEDMVKHSEVLKVAEDGSMETFCQRDDCEFNGLALGARGQLYIADMTGHIWLADASGKIVDELPCSCDGVQILPNDLVFGSNGDLFVANFAGNAMNPAGGVYRITKESGYKKIVPFQLELHTPNGIAFSPDGGTLWVAETCMNRIMKFTIDKETGGVGKGFLDACVVYQGQGNAGPDSMRTDKKGNIYQAYYPGGRALVLSPGGIPVANVIADGRAKGEGIYTAAPAISPRGKNAVLLSCGDGGARLLKFEPLAAGK